MLPIVHEDRLLPVQLSILPDAQLRYAWSLLAHRAPGRILADLSCGGGIRLLPYIAERYGDDPAGAARGIVAACDRRGIGILHYWDGAYPELLRQIHRPPLVLYCLGSPPAEPGIAVVGTRMADPRSAQVARRIAADLSGAGITVVSGMAVGIDREAHLGALEGPGGTVGVLANGIDIGYPASNADLFRAIRGSGVSSLLSEYPPGIMAGKWTFVRRNRIISGLCRGTVVVKAGVKSGALITARYAAEQNRDVFACPGFAFNEGYQGCHDLIRSGAILVSNTGDILQEFSRLDFQGGGVRRGGPAADFFRGKPAEYDENSIEGRILALLSRGEMQVDTVIRRLGCGAAEVQSALARMELEGALQRCGSVVSRM
ncbi:MAG: DNA-processing protein DprA [Spirochaetes bacterium]|nr:DNA-processing protein DprA [Spirochaetota bacterium]